MLLSAILPPLVAAVVAAKPPPPRFGAAIRIPAEYNERLINKQTSYQASNDFTILLNQTQRAMARAAFYNCPHEATSLVEWEYLLGCTEVNYDNLRMNLIALTYWDAETLFSGNANDTQRIWSAPPEIGETTFTKIA